MYMQRFKSSGVRNTQFPPQSMGICCKATGSWMHKHTWSVKVSCSLTNATDMLAIPSVLLEIASALQA